MLLYYLISLSPLELRCDTLIERILSLVSNVKARARVLSFHHIWVNVFKVADAIIMTEEYTSHGICMNPHWLTS